MSMPGRPRKPTAVKKMKGTLQKCRVLADEWKPPAGSPPEPPGMGRVATGLWRDKVRMLADAGVVTLADGEVLEAWCRAVESARLAEAMVKKEGITTETRSGVTMHPAVRIARNSWDAAARLGGLLGLDPSSRSRLTSPKKPESDDVGDFLSGKVTNLRAV